MNGAPWYLPATPSWSGVWSSNSSALSPIFLSWSPARTTVERQKLQTANGDAAERNSTGAPQLGHAARYARWGEGSEVANRCGCTKEAPRGASSRRHITSNELLQQLGLLRVELFLR